MDKLLHNFQQHGKDEPRKKIVALHNNYCFTSHSISSPEMLKLLVNQMLHVLLHTIPK